MGSNDPSVRTGRTNLIYRAWFRMRRAHPDRVGGVQVWIDKEIPMGAGLGGGSADAAATLVALNALFSLRLRRASLAELAASIGSDVPFFLFGGAARCRGRGEIVEPIDARHPPVHLVVVYPGFESPTAEAYRMLGRSDFADSRRSNRAARAIREGDSQGLLGSISNVFDPILCAADERYVVLKEAMKAAGLRAPTITGSGSACFGCAPDARAAQAARRRLLDDYPDVFAVRTLSKGILRLRNKPASR